MSLLGFPSGIRGKEAKRCRFDPWVGEILGKVGGGHDTPVFLPGESRGQRSLAAYSSWDRKESDTTEVTEVTVSLL